MPRYGDIDETEGAGPKQKAASWGGVRGRGSHPVCPISGKSETMSEPLLVLKGAHMHAHTHAHTHIHTRRHTPWRFGMTQLNTGDRYGALYTLHTHLEIEREKEMFMVYLYSNTFIKDSRTRTNKHTRTHITLPVY